MDRPGYVYIIKADTGHYKIGRTKNVPNRLRLFSIKLPFKFEIVHTFPCIDMVDAERKLHLIFAGKRVNGEWFNLDDFDIATIKKIEYSNWFRELMQIDSNGMHYGFVELSELLPDDYFLKYTYELDRPLTPLPGNGYEWYPYDR